MQGNQINQSGFICNCGLISLFTLSRISLCKRFRARKEEEKPTKTFLQKGFSRKQENWQ